MTLPPPSPLAAVIYERGFGIDEFMRTVVRRLRGEGRRVGGLLQENASEERTPCTTMIVVDMLTAERFVISQDLGPDARGCRLDPRGLLAAGIGLDSAIGTGLDLLVINKFGRGEAEGGGLRGAFAAAIETTLPVLTAVRAPYIEAWTEFHGGLAVDLAPDLGVVFAWCSAAVQRRHGNLPLVADLSQS